MWNTFRSFLKALALGLMAGLCLGALAGIAQKSLGLRAWVLPFDLFVGAAFGLVAGWCLALQTLVSRLFLGLFRVFADHTPWLGAGQAPLWTRQMDREFQDAAARTQGFLRWVLGKWMRAKLARTGPFAQRVDRVLQDQKARGASGEGLSDAHALAFAALTVLLFPIQRAFLLAYLLLVLAAAMFWTLPLVTG